MSDKGYTEVCPAAMALNAIAGKWKIPIVAGLLKGSKRFSELKEGIDGISSRILSKALRELENDGIIKRNVSGEMPIRTEYELTEIGVKLRPVLKEMKSWGETYKTLMSDEETAQEGDPKGSPF